MPIFDYHCHLSPAEIYENKQFSDIGEAWLAGDHYKWRVLRANAVPEKYVTGNASYRDKFDRFAAIMPCLIGNPIYHWSHLELKRFFGIDELLSSQTADSVWERANSKLKSPDGAARSLISESNVRALCTTDDPVDDLRYHRLLAEDNSFTTKVLPTFRPEKALDILSAGYPAYLQKLGAASGIYVRTLDDVKQALAARVEYFASCGCRLSDHSFGAPDFTVWDEGAAEEAMSKALAGEQLLDYEVAAYQSAIMDFLGGLYADKGFAMQLHIGAIRNLNTQRFRSIGVDIGCDSIGDTIPAASLAALLDRMAVRGKLPRTILYSLEPGDNAALVALMGCFQGPGTAGRLQHGSAWWFNDHKPGMEAQLTTLAAGGLLGNFIGMLTDSRSFLSYTRHEYFRRILCNLIGRWVEDGEFPDDPAALERLVAGISYRNSIHYFGFEQYHLRGADTV